MNSAPAVLPIPAIDIQSMSAPVDTLEDEAYPWAVNTPEDSPRCWDITPNMDCFDQQLSMQPMLSHELLQAACAPYFDQMCCSVKSDVFAQQQPAEAMVSRKKVRKMCEPFFEQMVTAVQHALQQQAQQGAHWQHFDQTIANTCYQYQATPTWMLDEESTDANDSCAFASLLSSTSSEGDAHDALERKSEASEPGSDAERSVMVCRHWKSKGWCRLEDKCKFLHPEHKCGVSAPRTSSGSLVEGSADGSAPPVPLVRRKKRGGKNRSNRGPQEQLGIESQ